MAYVEWHSGIQHHHKTERLAKLLGVNIREAVGIRGCLYAWIIENRPSGIIEIDLVPFACKWDGDDKALIHALETCGLLDKSDIAKSLQIHDWQDYTKGYRKVQADIERQKHKNGEAIARVSRDNSATIAGNGAEQSGTEQNGVVVPVGEAVTSKPTTSTPINPKDEQVRLIFQRSEKLHLRNNSNTVRKWIEAHVYGGKAAKLNDLFASDQCQGMSIIEIDSRWFAIQTFKTQPAQNGMNGNAPKCGVCADTGKVPVGVKDGVPELGPCSCIRRKVRSTP